MNLTATITVQCDSADRLAWALGLVQAAPDAYRNVRHDDQALTLTVDVDLPVPDVVPSS